MLRIEQDQFAILYLIPVGYHLSHKPPKHMLFREQKFKSDTALYFGELLYGSPVGFGKKKMIFIIHCWGAVDRAKCYFVRNYFALIQAKRIRWRTTKESRYLSFPLAVKMRMNIRRPGYSEIVYGFCGSFRVK